MTSIRLTVQSKLHDRAWHMTIADLAPKLQWLQGPPLIGDVIASLQDELDALPPKKCIAKGEVTTWI